MSPELPVVCVSETTRRYLEVLLLNQNIEISMNKERNQNSSTFVHIVIELKFQAEMESWWYCESNSFYHNPPVI